MKRNGMTVHEFANYLKGTEVKEVSFRSALQDWYDPASTLQFTLTFAGISVFENPNSIYLHDATKTNIMVLPHATYIYVENNRPDGCLIVRIISSTYTGLPNREVILSLR